jgi:SAM-dependent methyltransferase
MTTQAEIFHNGEGNRWLERNRARLGEYDMVSETMEILGIRPTFAVEIGCANGWRLSKLRHKYGCEVIGVEPSRMGCDECATMQVPAFQTTAATPPIRGGLADLLIYGFCLYLADPRDWFRIVTEGDRILKPGGHLIVHDFAAVDYPFARPYEHREGVISYHVDFAKFWEASPLYSLVRRTMAYERDQMVTVLKKLHIDSIEILPDGENP